MAPISSAERKSAASRLRRRVLRAPSVHFLLLGCLLFVAERSLGRVRARGPEVDRNIVISAADLDVLRGRRADLEGGVPSAFEGDEALVAEAVDEEVLYREARALLAARRDPVVENRLASLARYLQLGGTSEEPELASEARQLDLEQGDPVIRRYLVELMRLALAKTSPSDLPSESELEGYYARHGQDFAEPPRVSLTQVYLSRERRGAALTGDAKQLLDQLRRDAAGPESAASLGDGFVRGTRFSASPAELERVFGPSFGEQIDALPLRTWAGPVHSTYGLHLVWIEDRTAAHVPPLESVRNRVVHSYLRERGKEQLQSRLRTLRARFHVEVERPDQAQGAAAHAALASSATRGDR